MEIQRSFKMKCKNEETDCSYAIEFDMEEDVYIWAESKVEMVFNGSGDFLAFAEMIAAAADEIKGEKF